MKFIQTLLYVPYQFVIGVYDSMAVWRYFFWIQSQSTVRESIQKIIINAFILFASSLAVMGVTWLLKWLIPSEWLKLVLVFLLECFTLLPIMITLSVFNFFALQDMLLNFTKMGFSDHRKNNSQPIYKKLNAVAFELLRLLSLLFAKLLIRFIPQECAFVAVALIESYTIFDCWWCLGSQTVFTRLKHIESNPFYFLGFGFIPAYLLCFGSLGGAVLYQLFTPFFVLAALFRSHTTSTGVSIPFATGFVHLSSVIFLWVVKVGRGMLYLKQCCCCCSTGTQQKSKP